MNYKELAKTILGLVGATLAFSLSLPTKFDPNINERKSQTDGAGDTNNVIQSYTDTLESDIDGMTADVETYQGLTEEKTQTDIDTIANLGALQAEMNVYIAQG